MPYRKYGICLLSILLCLLAFYTSGVGNVIDHIKSINIPLIILLLLFLTVNLFVVSYRFWLILSDFGINIPWVIAAKANIAGHVASLFTISLFGQILGRQLLLKKFGVPASIIASLLAYERMVMAAVALLLCVMGAIYLLGINAVTNFISQTSIFEIFFIVIISTIFSFCIGKSKFERKLFSKLFKTNNIINVLKVTLISFLGQFIILLVYVLVINQMHQGINFYVLFCSAAIISFSAALPISINGWGVREVTSIYVLGISGVDPANAVAASIIVGICSTIAIAIAYPFALKREEIKTIDEDKHCYGDSVFLSRPEIDLEKLCIWFLTMSVATGIFFQAHVPLFEQIININLADPFAILALSVLVLHSLQNKTWPKWKIDKFNFYLTAFFSFLLISFINGFINIGLSQWALTGRVFGWFVLMGYLSSGYLMAATFGVFGRRRLFETLVCTSFIVIVVQLCLRVVQDLGVELDAHITPNFQGYSGNRNAFAFQLLICFILFVSYHRTYLNKLGGNIKKTLCYYCIGGVLITGVYLSGSRAGYIVLLLLTISVLRLNSSAIYVLFKSYFMAFMIVILLLIIANIDLLMGYFSTTNSNVELELGMVNYFSERNAESSDTERLSGYVQAIKLWMSNPIFGAGLGVFFETSEKIFDYPVVVHNTFLWMLSEMGVLTVVIVMSITYKVFMHGWRSYKKKLASLVLLLLIISFAFFSLVHEIFYQRIFWFILGAVLAHSHMLKRNTFPLENKQIAFDNKI